MLIYMMQNQELLIGFMQQTIRGLANCSYLIFSNKKQAISSNKIESIDEASFSCVVSSSYHMCNKYPDLPPPQFHQAVPNADYVAMTLEEKRQMKVYLQPWCDYFNNLFDLNSVHGELAEHNNVLYIVCKVTQQYFTRLKELASQGEFKQRPICEIQELIKKYKHSISKQSTINVGIINFAASQLKSDHFQPKVNLLSLYTGIWFKGGDSWRRYDVLRQQYPTQEQIMNTDVFILSGSTFSVNDNNPHVQKTMHLLKDGFQKNKKLKLLGLCFGHQAIAKYFGGRVEKKQLYSGIQVIKFNKQIIKQVPTLQQLNKLNDQGFLLFQFHNDYVVEVPKQFKIVAFSNSCDNEGMISNDRRCLTFQCHSQYTDKYTKDFELRLKKFFKQDVYPTQGYQMRDAAMKKYGMQRHHDSFRTIRETVRRFIQSNNTNNYINQSVGQLN